MDRNRCNCRTKKFCCHGRVDCRANGVGVSGYTPRLVFVEVLVFLPLRRIEMEIRKLSLPALRKLNGLIDVRGSVNPVESAKPGGPAKAA